MNTGNYAENNRVIITGTVETALSFSHEVYDETFYTFMIRSPRLSENFDAVRITISEKFLSGIELNVGTRVKISGQFRSYNNFSNVGNRLILTVFVKDIEIPDDADSEQNSNLIQLNGYICKQPVYRTTPFGREIADILLAVNRSYNKSDYIPCIAWGRNARFVNGLQVGEKITLCGRIQSRNYTKKTDETTSVTKTAYEISISNICLADNSAEQNIG